MYALARCANQYMPDKTGWRVLFFQFTSIQFHQINGQIVSVSNKKYLARELANALLAGDWTLEGLTQQLTQSLGYLPDWAKPLLASIHDQFSKQYPPVKVSQLASFINHHPLFNRAWMQYRIENGHDLKIRLYTLKFPKKSPPAFICEIPALDTIKDLANWLGVSTLKLEGYADVRGLERKSASRQQQHYHYIWKKKATGSARLLEIPKTHLRAIQRQIHTNILQKIPLHDACHGFRKKHSCLTFVEPHCAKQVVIRMDLRNFFSAIPLRRIHAIFETVGYRTEVARLLTGLCSNQVPHQVITANPDLSWSERKQYSTPHLPQGAPVSPALSNLAAFNLDVRLASLMKKMGGVYTRYADDLAFSGNFSKATCHRLHALVCHIAMDEGFSLNTQKTRIMQQGVRQKLTGLVLNRHANIPRDEYDQLKAILFNCCRYGPASQNLHNHDDFKAYLQGKVTYVKLINPKRAVRLERLFARIDWY